MTFYNEAIAICDVCGRKQYKNVSGITKNILKAKIIHTTLYCRNCGKGTQHTYVGIKQTSEEKRIKAKRAEILAVIRDYKAEKASYEGIRVRYAAQGKLTLKRKCDEQIKAIEQTICNFEEKMERLDPNKPEKVIFT